ncbi:translation initiation factor IF-2B subunit alpha [Gloeomargarita lithophora Alchichica-D10]|uniref:Methylthioribose-1-phosphate isomerase n=1 Tax=Gloeomargarita lithophora Alchichica-D10 TaxID=1188229 RepID=A0A1J0AG88_9CYAN|nr:S-methyl-5-thioribose-1-phosphate isomerase [Gloeomargarita lithophora]APB34920.1 translation initiation factor IF-2B subunit alpha [Gloeomargarita lithophora Alchichica-D10]
MSILPIAWAYDHVRLIDQTRLPVEFSYVEIRRAMDMVTAIQTMIVRGAPAIGVAAAFGIALAAQEIDTEERQEFLEHLETVATALRHTRPTAINLFWAIDQMLNTARQTVGPMGFLQEKLIEAAQNLAVDEYHTCVTIGDQGLACLPTQPQRLTLMTYCNAGALATAGYGTALGVIRSAHNAQRLMQVYVCETRPRLQGARLTAWECVQDRISATLITDNMAGYCMQKGLIHGVVVGADRIALNGDTANKIGTYSLAVLAHTHQIPFYVAAPLSSIDWTLSNGSQIPIEERDIEEVYKIGDQWLTTPGIEIFNPSFDVTPARYITGIITERGVVPPDQLQQLQP